MDLITDNWIRRCIGIAIVLVAFSVLALAATPLIYASRWW